MVVKGSSPAPVHRLEVSGGHHRVAVFEQSLQPGPVGSGHRGPGDGGVAEPGLGVPCIGQAPLPNICARTTLLATPNTGIAKASVTNGLYSFIT